MEEIKIRSLRWRLLVLVSVACLVIITLAAALTYRQAKREVHELMDGQMSKVARLLLAQTQQGENHRTDLPVAMTHLRGLRIRRNELTLEYQISKADGTVIAHSPNADFPAFDGLLGLSTISVQQKPWRSLTLETADRAYRIQIAQSIALRDKEALEISVKTAMPLWLMCPLLLLAIYFSVRRGLKPLDDLADDVAARSSENLQPIERQRGPREAQALIGAINHLLFRVSSTLEHERRFTADAAHELRTPLAATRIQAQVALLSEDPEKRQHALVQTLAGLDRSTRLVEQMLRLARLDPLVQLPTAEKTSLADFARQVVAGVLDANPQAHIEMQLDEACPDIALDRDLLEIALRNLLDNAIRYSPPSSNIRLTLRCAEKQWQLAVLDQGAGVALADLEKLGERFYRAQTRVVDGCGLGLAIVQRVADLHGAQLRFSNQAAGGFEAALCWDVAELTA